MKKVGWTYICKAVFTPVMTETFRISSTVHKDVSERLKAVDPALYMEVRQVLQVNKSERHIRGGMATRKKYQSQNGGMG